MAQKVNIVTVDDIDGTEGASTVIFGLDGTTYEIDLKDENADALRDALERFIDKARPVRSAGKKKRGKKSTGDQPSDISAQRKNREVRDWAAANGLEVSKRGRISKEVQNAYDEAHPIAG